jgi:hypothetical protein
VALDLTFLQGTRGKAGGNVKSATLSVGIDLYDALRRGRCERVDGLGAEGMKKGHAPRSSLGQMGDPVGIAPIG